VTKLTVAALQLAFGEDVDENIANVSELVREAAGKGAQVVLPPELFEGPYFCRTEEEALFATARPVGTHPAVLAMRALAAELGIFIPTSFFEADGPHHYNSLAMIDASGTVMGVYRKSHIPDGPGYSEKFYFRPGNSGFKTWPTPGASLGVGICWDQWYPEAARSMMLMGAEILLYPTAIGTEPHDPDLDTSRLWRRAMIGHAVSNVVPVDRQRRRPDLLRPQLHLRRARRHIGRVRRARERRHHRHARPRRGQAPPRRLRLLPRSPARALRTADRRYLKRPREHRFEHRSVQPTGILIVARAMIAIDQDAAVGEPVLGEMGEPVGRQLTARGAHCRTVRDLAERDQHAHVRQQRQAGSGLFCGGRHLTELRMTQPARRRPSSGVAS